MVTRSCQTTLKIADLDENHFQTLRNDCYCPCQLSPPINEYTYCILKKICRRILKEICHKQRREVCSVFDGGTMGHEYTVRIIKNCKSTDDLCQTKYSLKHPRLSQSYLQMSRHQDLSQMNKNSSPKIRSTSVDIKTRSSTEKVLKDKRMNEIKRLSQKSAKNKLPQQLGAEDEMLRLPKVHQHKPLQKTTFLIGTINLVDQNEAAAEKPNKNKVQKPSNIEGTTVERSANSSHLDQMEKHQLAIGRHKSERTRFAKGNENLKSIQNKVNHIWGDVEQGSKDQHSGTRQSVRKSVTRRNDIRSGHESHMSAKAERKEVLKHPSDIKNKTLSGEVHDRRFQGISTNEAVIQSHRVIGRKQDAKRSFPKQVKISLPNVRHPTGRVLEGSQFIKKPPGKNGEIKEPITRKSTLKPLPRTLSRIDAEMPCDYLRALMEEKDKCCLTVGPATVILEQHDVPTHVDSPVMPIKMLGQHGKQADNCLLY